MKTMEGVRKVTNRMKLVQNLRKNLVKARLSLIAVTFLLVMSGIANLVLLNKLSNEKEVVAQQNISIQENKDTIKELESKNAKLEVEVERLNSFDVLFDNVMNLEDICLEMIQKAEEVKDGVIEYVKNNKVKSTDLKYTDYVLNKTTGEKIRTFENNNEMFVVYISDSECEESLNSSLSNEYHIGKEAYIEAIYSTNGVLLVKHDYKLF